MKSQENMNTLLSGFGGSIATEQITEKTFRIFSDADHLSYLAKHWKNVASDKSQGHMFEQLETIKFNLDALKKDSDLFAKTTASMGLPTDPVDMIISNGKKTLREIQAKSCNSSARSTYALSDKKYHEMLRLAPSDQHSKIEELLNKRINAGTLKAEDYDQTLRNLKKTLEHDGISSGGTTYNEAIESTKQEVADKLANEFKMKSAFTDMHKSGKEGGKIGALLGGGASAVSEFYGVYNGDKELGEATTNIIVSSAKGYASGYVVTALSKGITHSTTHLLGEHLARNIMRSNAPAAISAGIVNAGRSMNAYLNGDIDAEQLADEVSQIAITSTSSFYYAALGQTLIPIPIVGAMLGAGVGYAVGNLLHQSGLLALGDSQIVKVSKERRQQVEAMCLASIPLIRKNRTELQQHIDTYFSDRQSAFTQAFSGMDTALINWDPDEFISSLNIINQEIGCTLSFKNFNEFDDFMLSDNTMEF
jgi:hypothetical protein